MHRLAINELIYAELSLSFTTLAALDAVVVRLPLDVAPLPRAALFLAGKAFLQCRRRGGTKAQVLPDFFIGAHAAVNAWPLLTRDATRNRRYFPTVELITP